jgi:hypothetical protein
MHYARNLKKKNTADNVNRTLYSTIATHTTLLDQAGLTPVESPAPAYAQANASSSSAAAAASSSASSADAAVPTSSLTVTSVDLRNVQLETINDPLIAQVIPYLTNQGDDTKSIRDLRNAAKSCRYFYSLFQPELTKLKVKELLQAVIDDKVEIVKRLLNNNPELLFAALDKDLVIESPHTWQRFNMKNKNALTVAAKRKQLGMIELLLSYCDKLEQTEAMQIEKAEALSAWTSYQIRINAKNEEEIVIPPEYKDYMQSLVNAFLAEIFPHGTGTPDDPDYTHLSDETEAHLSFLFNLLLPKNAVPLDDEYVDVELLLLTAYKVHEDNFGAFSNWEQRDAFCVRVVGLIMTALAPEMGKIFCEGLYDMMIDKNRKISERAQSLMLKDDYPFYRPSRMLAGGYPFYRSSRDSRSGVGFEYLCGSVATRIYTSGGAIIGCTLPRFSNYMQTKTRSFWSLCSKHGISTTYTACSMNRRAV